MRIEPPSATITTTDIITTTDNNNNTMSTTAKPSQPMPVVIEVAANDHQGERERSFDFKGKKWFIFGWTVFSVFCDLAFITFDLSLDDFNDMSYTRKLSFGLCMVDLLLDAATMYPIVGEFYDATVVFIQLQAMSASAFVAMLASRNLLVLFPILINIVAIESLKALADLIKKENGPTVNN